MEHLVTNTNEAKIQTSEALPMSAAIKQWLTAVTMLLKG